jgi:hypothetical protein
MAQEFIVPTFQNNELTSVDRTLPRQLQKLLLVADISRTKFLDTIERFMYRRPSSPIATWVIRTYDRWRIFDRYGSVRMGAAFTLFHLAGAVALLTCGLHMVQTGITRAYGLQLRRMHQRWKLVRIRSGEPQTPACRVALDRCEPARLTCSSDAC